MGNGVFEEEIKSESHQAEGGVQALIFSPQAGWVETEAEYQTSRGLFLEWLRSFHTTHGVLPKFTPPQMEGGSEGVG
jgi:hypothetical protein